MPDSKKVLDRFANVAALTVLESAPATLTFARFNFPFSVMDKVAILISRIEYYIGYLGYLDATSDSVIAGLSTIGSLVNPLAVDDPQIIDNIRILRLDHGTAGSAVLVVQPEVKDFSALAGGGIILAPSPLYAFIKGTGNPTAMSAQIRMYYTYQALADADYWQLVESRRIVTV